MIEKRKSCWITRAFSLLLVAIRHKKEALLMLVGILCVLSIVLATILYFVEMESGVNYLTTLAYIFVQYIGNPCHIVTFCPTTTIGIIIACIVGVINILFVAGITGVLVVEFFDEVQRQQSIQERIINRERISKALTTRRMDYNSHHRLIPPFISLRELQVQCELKETSLLDALYDYKGFRVTNLAKTISPSATTQDRLVVEEFKCDGAHSYGEYIDRRSKITIISPSNINSPGMGHYAKEFTRIGEFNYIGREIGDRVAYDNYLYNKKEEKGLDANKQAFFNDIDVLTSRTGAWAITLLPVDNVLIEPSYGTQFHFSVGGKKGERVQDMTNCFVQDKKTYLTLYDAITIVLKKYDITCDNQQYFDYSSGDVFVRQLQNRGTVNHIILNIDWQYILWSNQRYAIMTDIVNCINVHINKK